MLPVSGAEQFVASRQQRRAAHHLAQRRVVEVRQLAPWSPSGMNMFHRPRLRASVFSSSITGGGKCGSPESSRWPR